MFIALKLVFGITTRSSLTAPYNRDDIKYLHRNQICSNVVTR